MQIPSLARLFFAFILFAPVMAIVPGGKANLNAQALPTSQRKAELTAFGTYTHLTPDYGPQNNNGATFGVGYSHSFQLLTPAVEFRVKIANGETVNQKTYGGGIRLEHEWNRLHPYGMFMISAGYIDYHFRTPPIMSNGKPYLSDSSVVYGYGGGLDYDLTPRFAARGEFQAENWSLGGYTPVSLSPTMWSFGVVYRIPTR